MGVTEVSQVDKRPYRNQTAGWLGVVKLDHLGAQQGYPVEPHGTVWLTDDEATLTARAPAAAKDNPFVAKKYMFVDDQGQHVEQDMVPLVLVEDDREVPADERPTPVRVGGPIEASIAADARDTSAALADSDRPGPGEAVAPDDVTLAPASSAAVDPAYSRPAPEPEIEDQPESWAENPDRTEEPQPGALGGSNESPAPQPGTDRGPQGDAGSPAATASVTSAQPGAQAAEEHAAVTEGGEETGAAATPAQPPAEGEFAQHEEVGSPDAPAQGESQK